jgi:hypothetical protein
MRIGVAEFKNHTTALIKRISFETVGSGCDSKQFASTFPYDPRKTDAMGRSVWMVF